MDIEFLLVVLCWTLCGTRVAPGYHGDRVTDSGMGLEVLSEVPGQTPRTVDGGKAIMGRWLLE